jgi:hypothetical protein
MRFLIVALVLAACQAGAPSAQTSALPAQPASVSPSPSPSSSLPRATVTFGTRAIPVEVADTAATREHGLSGRLSLAQDTGLVLAWTMPTEAMIWMPDMNFAIDVIFVRDEKVVAIYPNAQPCPKDGPCPTFGPATGVNYVLEAPTGSATRWNLKIGDAINLVGTTSGQPTGK